MEEHEKQCSEHDKHGQELTPPPPSAPPTTPGEIKAHKKPIWPTVIAVIGFVICAFGFLGTFNLVMPWVNYALPDSMFAQSQPAQPLWMLMLQTVFQLFGLGLMVYLLMACIKLVKRQAAAAGMLRRFAVIDIVYSIFAVSLGIVATMMGMAAEFQKSGDDMPEFAVWIMIGVAALAFLFGLAFALAYPVFLLVWFRRNVVKEQIATWNA